MESITGRWLSLNQMNEPVTIFWFRRDLRLIDNSGLLKAFQWGRRVLPLFIFDPEILDQLEERHDRRIDFICGALQAMQKELLGVGSSLWVLHEPPLVAFRRIALQYRVEAVFANADYEPFAIRRDAAVEIALQSLAIPFFTVKDQVIFEKGEVLKSDGSPYSVFTPYSRAWKQKLALQPLCHVESEKLHNRFLSLEPKPLPDREELRFLDSGFRYAPPVIDRSRIARYNETRNYPALDGTSGLSPHLRFGTVSIRHLVAIAMEMNEVWLNELIWREFFMSILYHFPHVVDEAFKPKYNDVMWRNRPDEFEKWCFGKTGFPLVDAGMRELLATGIMHNRVRMVAAGFLTKHLLIDWRWGEAWFARHLLDFELSSNNGNWQWAAGTGCDAAPWFRIFNPSEQAKKFDSQGEYIRRWVPEVDTDLYPRPMVNHADARRRALETYSAAVNPQKF